MHRWLHSFSAKHQTLQFDFIPSNHSPIHFDRLIFIGKNYHANAKKYFVSGRRTCAKTHAWPTIWRPVQVLNRNKTWYVWFDSCHSATPLRDLSLCVGAKKGMEDEIEWEDTGGRVDSQRPSSEWCREFMMKYNLLIIITFIKKKEHSE